MKKQISLLLAALLLLPCLILPCSAREVSYVHDKAGLLTKQEILTLEETARSLSLDWNIDAVILTVSSLEGASAQDTADDFYDVSGYGENGTLLLIAMAEGEWYISTSGEMIYALTDYGLEQLGGEMVPWFAQGQWYDGFHCYLTSLPGYLQALADGAPVDGFADYSEDFYHGDREETVYYEEEPQPNFLLSLLIGAAVGGAALGIMGYSMNSRRAQKNASSYLNGGAWRMGPGSDLFLYSNVTKTRKQESSNSRGGGSSTHRSSGGRRHGGGGGKF